MQKVKDHIFVETEYLGCNPSFVVTSGGIVMIDTPQLPLEALTWKKEMQSYGEVVYLINTDHHRDHALGNYFFDGDIIVHEGTKKELLSDANLKMCRDCITLIDPSSAFLMAGYFVRQPRFTYETKMDLYLGGEAFELIHIRAHTQNETLVYLPGKRVLFTGDNVCTNGIPNLSESFPREWLKALDFMDTLDIDILVPGHGSIGNKDSVRDFRLEFQKLIERVQERINQGLPKEAVMKEGILEDKVHLKYPPQASERFRHVNQMSIARLYDVFAR